MIRLALIAAALVLAPAALAQQPYQPPRTPDGRPDFHGVWAARWLTPLERPPNVDRATVDAAQAATLAAAITDQRSRGNPLSPQSNNPDASQLAVVDGQYRTSMVVDPASGRIPLTAAGVARMEQARRGAAGLDGAEQRVPSERCLAGFWRSPIMLGPEGMLMQAVQTPDHILFHAEHVYTTRLIPLTPTPRPYIFSDWTGANAGHWEGDTLVVETTGARPDDIGRFAPFGGFPITPETKIVERFALTSPDTLLYRYTIEDAALYTAPWTAEFVLSRSSDRIYEFACHEGNYAMTNILLGARVVEERAAKAAAPTARKGKR